MESIRARGTLGSEGRDTRGRNYLINKEGRECSNAASMNRPRDSCR